MCSNEASSTATPAGDDDSRRFAELVKAEVEETARIENDPYVDIRAIWLDHERYERGALCALFRHGDKIVGLDWDLTDDPESDLRRSATASQLGMPIYFDRIMEPPGRTIRNSKLSEGVYWLTRSDKPPVVPPGVL